MCEYNPNSYLNKIKEIHERLSQKEDECRRLREEFIEVSSHAIA